MRNPSISKTPQGIANVKKAKGISMEMDNIPSLWALPHHHDLHLPTPLVLPAGPAPYLGLIFVARHRRRPPLPLTAHCCENMERGELNCTWDSDTADKRHVQYEGTQKKGLTLRMFMCILTPIFFTLWFKQDSWINYWSRSNQREQHMVSTSKVFLLK